MRAPLSSLRASSCLNSTVTALSQSTAAISTSVVLFMWMAPKKSVALKPDGRRTELGAVRATHDVSSWYVYVPVLVRTRMMASNPMCFWTLFLRSARKCSPSVSICQPAGVSVVTSQYIILDYKWLFLFVLICQNGLNTWKLLYL